MPYVITVLALVVIGTGYALLQNRGDDTVAMSDISPIVQPEAPSNIPTPSVSASTTEEALVIPVEDTAVPATTNTPTPSTPPEVDSLPVADSNTYSDGTYYAQKSYRTPEGNYQMDVSITVSDDKVTNTAISFDEKGAKSSYSKRFASGCVSEVMGQNLEGLSLSRVGGSSLTTQAFNSALEAIKSQAS